MPTKKQVAKLLDIFQGEGLGFQALPRAAVEGFLSGAEGICDKEAKSVVSGVEGDDFRSAVEALVPWRKLSEAKSREFWSVLATNGVDYKSLLVGLNAVMAKGKNMEFAEEKLTDAAEKATLSALLYLSLISIPGNYNFVNPVVLRSSLGPLKAVVSHSLQKKTKSNKSPEFWGKLVNEYIQALAQALGKVQVSTDILLETVEVLIDATRCVPASTIEPDTVYQALKGTLSDMQADHKETWKQILKGLKDNILLNFPSQRHLTAKSCREVRAKAIDFIKTIGRSDKDLEGEILALVHHLCFYCPDKSDIRSSIVEKAMCLLLSFPDLVRKRDFSRFIFLLSRNKRAGRRILGVQLAAEAVKHKVFFESNSDPEENMKDEKALVEDSEKTPEGSEKALEDSHKIHEDSPESLQPKPISGVKRAFSLVETIIARCSDKAAIVRGVSLRVLGEVILQTPSNEFLSVEFFHLLGMGKKATSEELKSGNFLENSKKSPFSATHDGVKRLMSLLERRSADERPNVRKAAVMSLESILTCGPQLSQEAGSGLLTETTLQAIYDACMDRSVIVRKQGMLSLSNLISRNPDDRTLQKIWLGAVLPLASDQDHNVQLTALKHIQTILLEGVMRELKQKRSRRNPKSDKKKAPVWDMLDSLDDAMLRYIEKAVGAMIMKKTVPNGFISALAKATSSNEKGVWILLRNFSFFAPEKLHAEGIVNAWWRFITDCAIENRDILKVYASEVLGNTVTQVSTTHLLRVVKKIQAELSLASLCAKALKPYIHILGNLSENSKEDLDLEVKTAVSGWENKVLNDCLQPLRRYLYNNNPDRLSQKQVARFLFVIGEVVIQQNRGAKEVKIRREIVESVQAFVQPASLSEMKLKGSKASVKATEDSKKEEDQVLRGEDLKEEGATDEKEEQHEDNGTSDISLMVRAHAFTTLGKLCLRSESLTKTMIPVLIKELLSGQSAVIRNNVLVILCDMCRTFTNAVDGQIDAITSCLRDSNEVIRRHSVMILIQLLQEDYIKWKGPMFFRAMRTVIDQDEGVKRTGRGALTKLIVTKWPRQFHKHFVEAIFYYNNYTSHTTYNNFPNWANESRFSLSGQANTPMRFYVYQYMLQFMQDEHKFNTTCKLCQDILGGVLDGEISFEGNEREKAYLIVKDCLVVLAGAGIKLQHSRKEGDEDIEDPKADRMHREKTKLLSAIVKKNAMENIIPLLIELKHFLEKRRSPLLKYLMMYFKELMSDYAGEVDEILAGDPQLATELKYDIERFNRKQKEKESKRDLNKIGLGLGSLSTPLAKMTVTPRKEDTETILRAASKEEKKNPKANRVFATPRLKRTTRSSHNAVSMDVTPMQRVATPVPERKDCSSTPQAVPAKSKTNAEKKNRLKKTNGDFVVPLAPRCTNKGANNSKYHSPAVARFVKKRGAPSPAVNAEIIRSPPLKKLGKDPKLVQNQKKF